MTTKRIRNETIYEFRVFSFLNSNFWICLWHRWSNVFQIRISKIPDRNLKKESSKIREFKNLKFEIRKLEIWIFKNWKFVNDVLLPRFRYRRVDVDNNFSSFWIFGFQFWNLEIWCLLDVEKHCYGGVKELKKFSAAFLKFLFLLLKFDILERCFWIDVNKKCRHRKNRWSTKRVLCPIGCYQKNQTKKLNFSTSIRIKVNQKIIKIDRKYEVEEYFRKNRLFYFVGLPWKIQVFVGGSTRMNIAPVL